MQIATTALHYRAQQYVWGEIPFKNLCPYFHMSWFSMLIIPFVVAFRALRWVWRQIFVRLAEIVFPPVFELVDETVEKARECKRKQEKKDFFCKLVHFLERSFKVVGTGILGGVILTAFVCLILSGSFLEVLLLITMVIGFIAEGLILFAIGEWFFSKTKIGLAIYRWADRPLSTIFSPITDLWELVEGYWEAVHSKICPQIDFIERS